MKLDIRQRRLERKQKEKKQEQNKRRFEAIKNLMSTFAMSTVAVVAVVTLIPASPKAKITKVVALNTEVVYQVNVTDKDNALDTDTLLVVLENQLEYYEQPISLGENSGFFSDLKQNTQYRLSVYGNKGFGQERLDTVTLNTREKVGGTILSVTPQTTDHETSYLVDVSIYDPDSKYTSINLFYGYNVGHEEELFEYFSLPLTMDREQVEISGIWTEQPFHIYLEGTTVDGSVLLDEIWVTPPFTLYTSQHIKYITKDEAAFHMYGDMQVGPMSFKMNVYKGTRLITTETIVIDNTEHEGDVLIIEGLQPNTQYRFESYAIYDDPLTLRETEVLVYSEELETLGTYDYDIVIEEFDEYYEVTLSIIDPNNHFQSVYYELIDLNPIDFAHPLYTTYPFTVEGNNKTSTFIIDKPLFLEYEITIGMRNDFVFQYHQIVKVLTIKEEE